MSQTLPDFSISQWSCAWKSTLISYHDWWLGDPLDMDCPDEHDEDYWNGEHWREDHSDDNWGNTYDYDSDDTEDSEYEWFDYFDCIPPEPSPKNTTTFMRVCRLVYHEACDYLYSNGRFGIKVFCHSGLGQLNMLGKRMTWKTVRAGAQAYSHVKRLDLFLSSDGRPRDVREAHELVVALVGWLNAPNQLQHLNILLDVHMSPRDDDQRVGLSYMRSQLVTQRPDDISRQQIAAFVIDPTRNLRLSQNGARLRIRFPGFRLAAFKHLPSLIKRDMRNTSKPPVDHDPFGHYTSRTDEMLGAHFQRPTYRLFERLLKKVQHARIKGDGKRLIELHHRFEREVLVALRRPEKDPWPWNLEAETTEEQFAEIGHTISRLCANLPRDVDTCDFGAVHGRKRLKVSGIGEKNWKSASKKYDAESDESHASDEDESGGDSDSDGTSADEDYAADDGWYELTWR
ncbi:hypothetical protein LTR85_007777 [Meristemomyces frigidus]|nr:hypothetical protein LTR85_007777 [Meristemomyces frigidus]